MTGITVYSLDSDGVAEAKRIWDAILRDMLPENVAMHLVGPPQIVMRPLIAITASGDYDRAPAIAALDRALNTLGAVGDPMARLRLLSTLHELNKEQ